MGGLPAGLRGAIEYIGQAAAFDKFQRKKRSAVRFADFMDLNNVGMLEACDRLRLIAKASQLLRSGVGAREDHLEGDQTVQTCLPRFINDTHAPAAEFSQNLKPG